MKKNEVSFTVVYNPSIIEKTGELMSKMDLGITGIEQLQSEIWSWTTTTEVDRAYLKKMKNIINSFLVKEGHRVVSIKGKKI
jgi:hypothetical protein